MAAKLAKAKAISARSRGEAAIARIEKKLLGTGEREVPSRLIGESVMSELAGLDHVAYIRFASVYRSFQDVNEFREVIDHLELDPKSPLPPSEP